MKLSFRGRKRKRLSYECEREARESARGSETDTLLDRWEVGGQSDALRTQGTRSGLSTLALSRLLSFLVV